MIEIPLRDRHGNLCGVALIDREDADLAEWRWHRTNKGYARGAHPARFLHRAVLRLPLGDRRQADHINGDRLDCRRVNLRTVEGHENMQNKCSYAGSASPYRGVSRDKNGTWRAQAQLRKRKYHLGNYATEIEAAAAASAFRRKNMPYSNEGRLRVQGD